jgi:integrase
MLAVTKKVVGIKAAPSWRYVLHGLWESGLRLNELLHVHWSDESFIFAELPRAALPVRKYTAAKQKNATVEAITLLPGFETLLRQTPEEIHEGWAFSPLSLQTKVGRKVLQNRVTVGWASKVIVRIGKKAGVIVLPAKGDESPKYASAHDLRRSCADRLVAAGVSERDVAAVMRHASVETTRRHYAPGNVQRTAGAIRRRLAEA